MAQQQQQVAEKWTEETVRKLLEPAQKTFSAVVKRDNSKLVWAREADFATQAITRDAYFKRCPQETIVEAVKNLAFLGLSLNPARGHAVILPRYNRKTEHYEAAAMVMYRGFAYLANQAGVRSIKSEVVYSGDTFKYGSNSQVGDWYEYQLNAALERGTGTNPFIGSFVAAKMPAGDLKFEWLPSKDVFRIRDMSESYLDESGKPRAKSPWVRWFDEMAKKAGIKRAFKRWEEMMVDSERWERFLHAVKIDNESEGVLNEKDEAPTPMAPQDVVTCLSDEQIKRIREDAPSAKFVTKICKAYNVDKLEKIDQRRYTEILERIKAAKEAQAARAAT